MLAVPEDGSAVECERRATDVPAFQAGAPHAGADPLDDQVPFEFGDGANDDDDGAAQRPGGIDLLTEADELNPQVIQLVEHLEEVPSAPGEAIAGPDQQDVESTAASIPHHFIQPGPARLGAGYPVGILGDDLEAALCGHLAKVEELCFRVLVQAADSQIKTGAHHGSFKDNTHI